VHREATVDHEAIPAVAPEDVERRKAVVGARPQQPTAEGDECADPGDHSDAEECTAGERLVERRAEDLRHGLSSA
jgi:hypothetical protein